LHAHFLGGDELRTRDGGIAFTFVVVVVFFDSNRSLGEAHDLFLGCFLLVPSK
jgi:hypothetical protein